MKQTAILGLVLMGAVGYGFAGCGSDNKSSPVTGSGGQPSNTGGSSSAGGLSSTGGSTTSSTTSTGGSSVTPNCDTTSAGPERFDAGLVQIGATDPKNSVPLDVGGFFARGDHKGYCFTYADAKPDGSTVFPPCGGVGKECFTKESGLCATAKLGVASADIWGAGIGCALNQPSTDGAVADKVSLVGKSSISVEVYGCKTPAALRLQLNIYPPIYDEAAGKLHSGYYCGDVNLSEPDANGARKGTIEIANLREDCWTGTGLLLDPANQTAESIQLQINSDKTLATEYDFCVSKLALE